MESITIIVADDHTATRNELVQFIQSSIPNSHVEHAVGTGDAAVKAYHESPTDVVVMDLNMPDGINGLEATKQLQADFPDSKILILSNYADAGLVKFSAEVGALGYVRKDRASEELGEAIISVYEGKRYIGQGLHL